eukprot:359469-Chlamydomonas_euryale.AAC.12
MQRCQRVPWHIACSITAADHPPAGPLVHTFVRSLPLVGLVSMASWSYRRTPEEVQALTKSTGMQQSVIVPNGGALQASLTAVPTGVPSGIVRPAALCLCDSLTPHPEGPLFVRPWQHYMGMHRQRTLLPLWHSLLHLEMQFGMYVNLIGWGPWTLGWALIPGSGLLALYRSHTKTNVLAPTDAPWKTRLNDLMFIAILETLVAASALLYCMFLMPVFFQITSSWGQMAWLCIAHPLYFEVTTGYIVRKALFRNIQLGRTHIPATCSRLTVYKPATSTHHIAKPFSYHTHLAGLSSLFKLTCLTRSKSAALVSKLTKGSGGRSWICVNANVGGVPSSPLACWFPPVSYHGLPQDA